MTWHELRESIQTLKRSIADDIHADTYGEEDSNKLREVHKELNNAYLLMI